MNQPISRADEIVIDFFKDYNTHREAVKKYIKKATMIKQISISLPEYVQLNQRALRHDRSKEYNYEEFSGYINMTKELKPLTYGTPEHKAIIDKYKYAVELHYKNNDHHPEHFKNGIKDMNKVQIIEMVCDWVGAMKCRNTLDNYKTSMEFNKKRFSIPEELYKKIFSLVEYLIQE